MIGNTNDLSTSSKGPDTQRSGLIILYVVFGVVVVLVHHWIAEGEFRSVLTLSAIFQCLAFSLLGVHVLTTGRVHGISAKCLQLEAIALVCRLSSTTWLLGYLPNDPTADFLYQSVDILSLVLVLGLLHQVLNVQRETYDSDNDTLPIAPFVVGAFLLACLLHANLDERPIFDSLWMCGLFLNCVAVVPYLWLMIHSRGAIPALTSHFVAMMAIARILSGAYMWEAHEEFTCKPWIGNFNHSGYSVLAAHALHLMLLADFAYFYVKNLTTAGLHAPLELSSWIV
jgi:hypothetical protein